MADPEQASSIQPIYGLDDKPELPRTLVLSAQHVLTMFGATVSVPLLFGPVMGMTAVETARLISAVTAGKGRVGIGIELGVPDQKPGAQQHLMTIEPGHAGRVVPGGAGIVSPGLRAGVGRAHARRGELLDVEAASES